MQRLILWAGALSCIAVSDASGQSTRSARASCSVGADCGNSYFAVANKTESVFELLLLNFFSSGRGSGKRAVRALGEIPTFPNEALENVRPDDAVASTWAKESSSLHDSRTPAGARNSWDWSEIAPQLREWGWPGFDFKQGRRDTAGDLPRDARSDDLKPDRGAPRRSESPSDDHIVESPPENRETPAADLPDRPDIIQEPNAEITPEPSTLVLVSTGVPLAFAFFRRRRRR